MMYFESLFASMAALTTFAVTAIFLYCKWKYQYWERHEVPYFNSKFSKAVYKSKTKLSEGELAAKQYKIAKQLGFRHVGLYIFTKPYYMPIQPDFITNMLVKDFDYFHSRRFHHTEKEDPLSGHLVLLSGSEWKHMRTKLTPTFTSGKIKLMCNIVVECSHHLKQAIDKGYQQGPVNIKNYLERLGIDVIGSCAFGLQCNSFSHSNSDIYDYAKRIFNPSDFDVFKSKLRFFFPKICKLLNVKVVSPDITNFFMNTVRNAIEFRKTKGIVRNDFLQLLIDLMKDESGLTIEEVAAQAFVFIAAGFESSSNTVTFCLFELAQNQEIQDKLRKEVNDTIARYNGVITYECLNDMAYMRQVLDEVLRKYPPFPVIPRVCNKDYRAPKTGGIIKKGMPIIIPLWGIQNDPEYFPEPEKFDPDRFAPENKEKIPPFAYMPFGAGPRFCIGFRFAFLQMKVTLCTLLQNYKFTLNERTKLPLKMNPKHNVLSPLGSIWLNVEKI